MIQSPQPYLFKTYLKSMKVNSRTLTQCLIARRSYGMTIRCHNTINLPLKPSLKLLITGTCLKQSHPSPSCTLIFWLNVQHWSLTQNLQRNQEQESPQSRSSKHKRPCPRTSANGNLLESPLLKQTQEELLILLPDQIFKD